MTLFVPRDPASRDLKFRCGLQPSAPWAASRPPVGPKRAGAQRAPAPSAARAARRRACCGSARAAARGPCTSRSSAPAAAERGRRQPWGAARARARRAAGWSRRRAAARPTRAAAPAPTATSTPPAPARVEALPAAAQHRQSSGGPRAARRRARGRARRACAGAAAAPARRRAASSGAARAERDGRVPAFAMCNATPSPVPPLRARLRLLNYIYIVNATKHGLVASRGRCAGRLRLVRARTRRRRVSGNGPLPIAQRDGRRSLPRETWKLGSKRYRRREL